MKAARYPGGRQRGEAGVDPKDRVVSITENDNEDWSFELGAPST
jgi:hypothetical protein